MLLDIGSGTGSETVKLATALGIHDGKNVMCLERSWAMQQRLKRLGFRTAGDYETAAAALPSKKKYSVASLLNVLDRVDDPAGLIDITLEHLEPGGVLVIAIVLPYWPGVHEGKIGSQWGRARKRKVKRPLQIEDRGYTTSFEEHTSIFVDEVLRLQPQLKLERWTRLPYLSSGDTGKTHYSINMALMAFRAPGTSDSAARTVVEPDSTNSATEVTEGDPDLPTECKRRKSDVIYDWLSSTLYKQGLISWGDILDAGAGYNSMCWLMNHKYSTITEVTAVEGGTYGGQGLREATANNPKVKVVVGNWRNKNFMPGTAFDVVVADYFLGAVERHWAHGASAMLERLLRAVKPGGYLLLVGLEPYESVLDRSSNDHDRLILDVEAIGDSAATIAGEKTYREIPEEWVKHQVNISRCDLGNFQVVATRHFPMRLTRGSLLKQIEYAQSTSEKIEDRFMRSAYQQRIKALKGELHANWPRSFVHRRASNYAVVVRRAVQINEDV
eukprot:g5158.t1